jgi:hypothetical protein
MSLSRTETSHCREPSDEEQHHDPRSFREYVELLASCVRDARAMTAAATRKTLKARLRQDRACLSQPYLKWDERHASTQHTARSNHSFP